MATVSTKPVRRKSLTRVLNEWIRQYSVREYLRRLWMRYVPHTSQDNVSFMSSFVFHLVLLVIFALLTFDNPFQKSVITLRFDDGAGNEFLIAAGDSDDSAGSALSESEWTEAPHAEVEVLASMPSKTVATIDAFQVASESSLSLTRLSVSQLETMDVGTPATHGVASSMVFASSSTSGRTRGDRRGMALRNGGSEASEKAVDAALVWLANHQAGDGSWSTEMSGAPCRGRCRNGTNEFGSPKRVAATGLALLCFLGAGHTHQKGEYREVVSKGLNHLAASIKKEVTVKGARTRGRFLTDADRYEMYEHGIAVLALCEAYEMTKDTRFRETCEIGIEFIEFAQCIDGSWGYQPKITGDLSIVGWQLMALKSAHMAGIKVSPAVVERTDKFLDSQQSDYGAYYGYRSTKREPGTTAIGLLIRLYRGWSRTDPNILKGAEYLAELGPSIDGIYYNYYATQVLYHMKMPQWERWNQMVRDHLVAEQEVDGHEAGSWHFGRNHFNEVGGRLYCTAMATLTLEVYYRYLPIYSDVDEEPFQL